MKIVKSLLHDVKCIEMPRFEDRRGSFTKIFEAKHYADLGVALDIREMYYSVSARHVIRGMHFQVPPAEHSKYVFVLRGAVRDVVLDLRKGSPVYGKAADVVLSAGNRLALFIPPGFAHGFLSLEDHTVMQYAVSGEYDPAHDRGILWNSFGYDWGVDEPVISERDRGLHTFDKFESPFR
ncbi:MAG: dTDP-4-dehydrorhamnose 3,5-epimerase family protein [Candidatus Marinimicrobia bacterium]|nr:dTDP-4-dehydrorhamnose 3,5-epimerase family protein [Candidatus Neomarinimicrobiota bacterium]